MCGNMEADEADISWMMMLRIQLYDVLCNWVQRYICLVRWMMPGITLVDLQNAKCDTSILSSLSTITTACIHFCKVTELKNECSLQTKVCSRINSHWSDYQTRRSSPCFLITDMIVVASLVSDWFCQCMISFRPYSLTSNSRVALTDKLYRNGIQFL
jgi:hypothetical protein